MNNRLVFVHDHKFRRIGEEIYSTGGLSDAALERYTKVFGEILVIARVIDEVSPVKKYSKISNKKVRVIDGTKLSKREFRDIIKNADRIISRMPSLLGYKAIRLATKYKRPYLVEVVGCAWDALWNHSIKGKILALPSFIIMKALVKKSKYTIYVTNEFLQKRYPTQGEMVSCSNVSLEEVDITKLQQRIEKILLLNINNKIVIGTTAAIDVRYKGQQYVIKALGRLKKEGFTNFEYQLVGAGNSQYLNKITMRYDVVDQVKILGSMSHEEVFNWLDTIDIYVQPSKQEGLPRALIEAMSRGVPAFGAKTAGIPELLESEFIFSNSKNNIKEICRILKKYDKNTMHNQAIRNYKEAQKYDKELIEGRRSDFLYKFKEDIK